MLKKVHIIGLGLMGTNLGIKLVNSGIKVSGSDISEKNVGRAKDLGAISLDHLLILFHIAKMVHLHTFQESVPTYYYQQYHIMDVHLLKES